MQLDLFNFFLCESSYVFRLSFLRNLKTLPDPNSRIHPSLAGTLVYLCFSFFLHAKPYIFRVLKFYKYGVGRRQILILDAA